MLNDRQKLISRNIPPIIVGGFISILAHFVLIYLGSTLFNEEIESSDLAIIFIAFFIPSMFGGFVSGYFFVRTRFIHTVLQCIIFFMGVIFPELIHFFLNEGMTPEETYIIKIFLAILCGAMTGGYIGIRMKKKKIIG